MYVHHLLASMSLTPKVTCTDRGKWNNNHVKRKELVISKFT